MKQFTIILFCAFIALFSIAPVSAQNEMVEIEPMQDSSPVVRKVNSTRRTNKEEEKQANELSVRAQEFNSRLRNDNSNAPWKRIIYRELSLDSAANTALYYPPRPTLEEQNLFSTIFGLVSKGAVKAYEYVDGYEIFDQAHELAFGDFLDRFGIMYEENPSSPNGQRYKIATADIPSDLVKSYFIKEEYYFDPIRSTIDTRVLALCPVLYDSGEMDEPLRFPLFWVTYETLRPYLSTLPVMLSDINNAQQSTMDNYFRMRLYNGEIYKTRNRLGRALTQYCPTPDSLRNERARIEGELVSFEKALWQQRSSATEEMLSEESSSSKSKSTGKTARARRQQQRESGVQTTTKTPKPLKQPKASKAARSSNSKRSARSRF